MRHYATIVLILLINILMSGCALIPTFGDDPYMGKYPGRPKDISSEQILQRFNGKPIALLEPYMPIPSYKGEKWIWGEKKNAYVDIGNGQKQYIAMNCQIIIDVDNNGIIKNIDYNYNVINHAISCPNLTKLDTLSYIVAPDLYKFEKEHNILTKRYLTPEQDTNHMAQKLGIQK